jgi:hypothetical protein
VSENTELLMEAPQDVAQEPASRTAELTEQQFDQLVEKLIYIATADGILPQDALAALAKALGTLSAFSARREGLVYDEVLTAAKCSVETFAGLAEAVMKSNADFEPLSALSHSASETRQSSDLDDRLSDV